MADLNDVFGDSFDPNSVPSRDNFDAIKPGKYSVIVEKATVKDTKAGTGLYVEIQFQIIDGEYRNRKLWARMNLRNPSQDCERIGRQEFSEMCKALQSGVVNTVDQLLNKTCIVKVIVKDEQNEIKKYESLSNNMASAPTTQSARSSVSGANGQPGSNGAPPISTKGKPPWVK